MIRWALLGLLVVPVHPPLLFVTKTSGILHQPDGTQVVVQAGAELDLCVKQGKLYNYDYDAMVLIALQLCDEGVLFKDGFETRVPRG